MITNRYISLFFKKNRLGLADDDSDAGEKNGNNDTEMVEMEKPLPVCNKPFIVKKFRDALRRGDCITGECCVHKEELISVN